VDFPKNSFLSWALKNIPNNQSILTNGEIYDPLSLIGKKTFLGRIQYIFVYGGDAAQRQEVQSILLQGKDKLSIMKIVQKENLHYVVLYKNNFAKNEKPFNENFYNKNAIKLYEDSSALVYKI
ncbi:MAG: hypothetical protein ACREGI_01380, partial [Candidatus Levyibacteriota bacterium]